MYSTSSHWDRYCQHTNTMRKLLLKVQHYIIQENSVTSHAPTFPKDLLSVIHQMHVFHGMFNDSRDVFCILLT